MPPPRPPPGPLPGGSRRGSVAAVLWRAARRGPGLQFARIFRRPPPPSEGTRAAAKQRYQSPPREEEEPELQPRLRWTRCASPPSLPRACWFWGGAGEGTPDAPGLALASEEGRAFLKLSRARQGFFRESPGRANEREDRVGGLAGRPNSGPLPAEPPPPAVAQPGCRAHGFVEGRGGGPASAGAVPPLGRLLPVFCPRGRQSWSAYFVGPHLGTGHGQRPCGSVLLRPAGSSRPLPARTRGAPRPVRTQLVVSFFSDRNGVIVGDGKLRRVPTMGMLSFRAVWVAGCAGWRGQSDPHIGVSSFDSLSWLLRLRPCRGCLWC